jgi:DNA-binding response OmpR family regulator
VVVTARGTPATRAVCFAYGASAFLEKPIDVNVLRSVASDVLAIGTARREDQAPPIDPPDRVQVRDAFLRMRSTLAPGVPMVLALVEVDLSRKGWDEDGRMPAELADRYRRVTAALQESLQPGDVMRRWAVSEIVVLFQGREPEACVRVLERAQGRVEPRESAFFAGVTEVEESTLFEDAVSWANRLVSEARLGEGTGILRTTLAKSRAPFALVVEDDPITASLLKHRLERSGFEVEHHDNGLRGLEAIRRTLPDLVVLDIRLPGMDGFEILSRMKAEGVTKNVRTMVLTGLGRESDVSRAFGLGADDYIVKPFSPVELTARALRLVRQ